MYSKKGFIFTLIWYICRLNNKRQRMQKAEEEQHAVNLLQTIDTPDDLKKLSQEQLPQVCSELRQMIIDELSHNPGHFGSSLGTVELTVKRSMWRQSTWPTRWHGGMN